MIELFTMAQLATDVIAHSGAADQAGTAAGTSAAWFTQQEAGLWGGVLGGGGGALLGTLGGGIGGPLAAMGKGKRFVIGLFVAFIAIGVGLIGVCGWAIIQAQPMHVWFVFLLPGVLLAAIAGSLLPVVHGRYAQAEKRRMSAEEIRRATPA